MAEAVEIVPKGHKGCQLTWHFDVVSGTRPHSGS